MAPHPVFVGFDIAALDRGPGDPVRLTRVCGESVIERLAVIFWA